MSEASARPGFALSGRPGSAEEAESPVTYRARSTTWSGYPRKWCRDNKADTSPTLRYLNTQTSSIPTFVSPNPRRPPPKSGTFQRPSSEARTGVWGQRPQLHHDGGCSLGALPPDEGPRSACLGPLHPSTDSNPSKRGRQSCTRTSHPSSTASGASSRRRCKR